MSPILMEFTVEHPTLQSAMSAVPDVEVEWEETDTVDGTERVLLWASGCDFDSFETALVEDPTVESVSTVTETGGRRLFKLVLGQRATELGLYTTLIEEGVVIHDLAGDADGWTFRVTVPDRNSFASLYDFCVENDLPIEVHSMYEQRDHTPAVVSGLTEPQLATLEAALECGYFDIPRNCTLAELSERLGISSNAASERIRRAMETLATTAVTTA